MRTKDSAVAPQPQNQAMEASSSSDSSSDSSSSESASSAPNTRPASPASTTPAPPISSRHLSPPLPPHAAAAVSVQLSFAQDARQTSVQDAERAGAKSHVPVEGKTCDIVMFGAGSHVLTRPRALHVEQGACSACCQEYCAIQSKCCVTCTTTAHQHTWWQALEISDDCTPQLSAPMVSCMPAFMLKC